MYTYIVSSARSEGPRHQQEDHVHRHLDLKTENTLSVESESDTVYVTLHLGYAEMYNNAIALLTGTVTVWFPYGVLR